MLSEIYWPDAGIVPLPAQTPVFPSMAARQATARSTWREQARERNCPAGAWITFKRHHIWPRKPNEGAGTRWSPSQRRFFAFCSRRRDGSTTFDWLKCTSWRGRHTQLATTSRPPLLGRPRIAVCAPGIGYSGASAHWICVLHAGCAAGGHLGRQGGVRWLAFLPRCHGYVDWRALPPALWVPCRTTDGFGRWGCVGLSPRCIAVFRGTEVRENRFMGRKQGFIFRC